jgi:Ca2+-binding RTX toxin-like protein
VITVALATLPTPAGAARVTSAAGTIKYEAEAGEANTLRISSDGSNYVFVDSGAPVLLGFGACQGNGCPVVGVAEIRIALADGSDQLTIDDSVSALAPAPGLPRIVAEGGASADLLTGGAGPEVLSGGAGDDRVRGGGGNDHLDYPAIDPRADQTLGSDTLDGGPGDDELNGGPTREQQESDTLIGGDGTDTADFSARTSSLTIDLDGRADDGESGESDDVEPDVENMIAGSSSDALTGSSVANNLNGGAGEDKLKGGGGDDTLDAGANSAGSDILRGGDGPDRLIARAGDDTLDAGPGDDTLSGAGGSDTLEAGAGNDVLAGGAGADTLDGGAGDDVLNGAQPDPISGDGADDLAGGFGADDLIGGDGNDELNGGHGPDYISGGAGRDAVSYAIRTNAMTVTLNGLADDGERGEADNVLPDVETVVGGTRGDSLYGDAHNNTVDGGSGEDFITGNLGNDRLVGGKAPDLVQARDGVVDLVACGDGGDLVIPDPSDRVRDCETVDRPVHPHPRVGRYAVLRTEGDFALQLPSGRRFFPWHGTLTIPIGSTVDPKASVVRLTTARTRSGVGQQVALVSAGRFTVRQKGDRRPITEFRLAGGPPDCPWSSRRRGVTRRRPPRELDVAIGKKKKQRGRYEVRGRYSIAGAVGTSWLTEDRCDGTFTHVDSGVVRVRDLVRKKIVTVRAGDSYLAHAP